MEGHEGINQDAGEGKSGRTRKPKRTTTTPVRKDEKRALNLRIDEDAHERLAIHALRRKTTISALVEGFAREHLREFSIHRNANGGKAGE